MSKKRAEGETSRSRWARRIVVGVAIVLGVAAVGIMAFALYVRAATYQPEPDALESALTHPSVSVRSESRYWVIVPEARDAADDSAAPLIYYPGGLVAPESYLRSLVLLAERTGRGIYLVRAPFNAAIFDVGAAQRIIALYGLERPIVGGHSLGGISACRFASANPDSVSGLLIVGSYCDRDLTTSALRVFSVMGDEDRIINRDNYREARANLPNDATILDVPGLNHSAFGDYGLQRGDGISNLEVERVVAIIAEGLR